jgi:hypothetical protein
VGSAVHPHGRVTVEVLVHCGTRQVPHAVAVRVTDGQLTVLHGLVTVAVTLTVLVLVTLTVSVLVAVLTVVLTLVMVDVRVEWLM